MNKMGMILVDALVALILTITITISTVQICNNINQFNKKVNSKTQMIMKERDEQIRSYYN